MIRARSYNVISEKIEMSRLLKYIIIAIIVLFSNLLWFSFRMPINNGNNPFFSFNSYYILSLVLDPINLHSWPGSLNSTSFSNFPGVLLSTTFYSLTDHNYPTAVFLLGYFWQLLGAYSIYYISELFLKWENIDSRYSVFAVLFYLFNESQIQGNPFLSNMPILITFALITYLALFKSFKFIWLLGFFSFFAVGNFPFLTIECLEIFFILNLISFILLIAKYKSNLKSLSKMLKELSIRSISSFLIILASVSFLVAPFLSMSHTYYMALTTPTPTYAFGFWPDVNLTLQNSIRLINNWSYFTSLYAPPWYQVYISNPAISIFLWVLPLLSLGSILFIKKTATKFFYVVLILVIFLSKANNPPLGGIFVWLINNIALLRPYYNGSYFEPFQLSLYIAFSTVFIAGLLTKVKLKRNIALPTNAKKIVSFIIILLITSLSIISVYPLLTTTYSTNNPTTPQNSNLPAYYNDVSSFLHSSDPNAPVIVFPNPGQWSTLSNSSHIFYYGGNPYYDLIANPVIAGTSPTGYVSGRSLSFSAINYIYSLNLNQPTLKLVKFSNLSNIIKYYDNFNGQFELFNSTLKVIYNTSKYYSYGAVVNGTIKNYKPFEYNRYFYFSVSNSSLKTSNFKIGIESPGYLRYYIPIILFKTTNSAVYYMNLSSPQFTFRNSTLDNNQIQIFYMYSENNTSITPVSASLAFSFNNGTSLNLFSCFLANLLSDIGIKYEYVDCALANSGSIINASLYNKIFSSSIYFKEVLKKGSVTVYTDTLYNGVLDEFQPSQETYINETLISAGERMIASGEIVKPDNLNDSVLNSIEYKVELPRSSEAKVIVLKTQYNSNCELFINGKFLDTNHFVALGYSNYWIVPSNTTYVLIKYNYMQEYSFVELTTISIPFIFMILYIIFEVQYYIKRRN